MKTGTRRDAAMLTALSNVLLVEFGRKVNRHADRGLLLIVLSRESGMQSRHARTTRTVPVLLVTVPAIADVPKLIVKV